MDPFAMNVAGVQNLIESKTNKNPSGLTPQEGIVGEKVDALELSMSDEQLIKLADKWDSAYASYIGKMKPIFDRNLQSYLGKRADGQWLVESGPIAANYQFAAEETFLAAALSKNPEPYVYAANDEAGNAISNDVKTMLQFHFDQLVIRRKLAFMVRQWSVYHLGVLKFGWDPVIKDITVENRRVQEFVFDPQGYVDATGDFTSYLGEPCKVTAEKLIEMFPKHREYIELVTDGQLGTECLYMEWWTDKFGFVKFKDKILDKYKNPHFRYAFQADDGGQPEIDPETGEPMPPQMVQPRNHFAAPKKPYVFLSVYSLQEQPHDITGNIEQNIANQNLLARRTDQVDKNVDASNNGYAFSEDNFNEQTAKQAATARTKGNPILIPSGGPIGNSILPLPAQPLPHGHFESIQNHKDDILFSWGVQGIAATAPNEDQTARGMILNQSHDTSRIGGGIGDAIEQVASSVANWLVQLYHVYYDEPHFAAVMGNAKAVEYITLTNTDFTMQLIVGVAPDSMKPKDEITKINLAQALFDKGAIGPKTLLKMVDFPDVEESAADGVLWKIDPMGYFKLNFPDYAAKLQQQQQRDMAMAAGGATPLTPSPGGAPAPEAITEPTDSDLAEDPASAALKQVPLPPIAA